MAQDDFGTGQHSDHKTVHCFVGVQGGWSCETFTGLQSKSISVSVQCVKHHDRVIVSCLTRETLRQGLLAKRVLVASRLRMNSRTRNSLSLVHQRAFHSWVSLQMPGTGGHISLLDTLGYISDCPVHGCLHLGVRSESDSIKPPECPKQGSISGPFQKRFFRRSSHSWVL